MTTEDEIAYRSRLLEAARNGKKLGTEERKWLCTNSAYSSRYGYPYLSMDVLKLLPNTGYTITVRLISSCSKHILTPTFAVSHGNGCIQWAEQGGEKASAKMLSTANSREDPVVCFSFRSDEGLMTVTYHYKTVDHRGTGYWNSSTVDDRLAMLRTEEKPNEVIYSCSDIDDDRFDKFIFSVTMEEIQKP